MPPLVALVAPDANDGALFSGRGPKIAPPPGEGDDPEARSWPDVTPETPTDRPTTSPPPPPDLYCLVSEYS